MLGNVGGRFRQTRETSEDCGCEASILIEKVIMAWPWERTPRIRKWCARQPKIVCAASQMVCAPIQNDVRSWQNGVRAISDGTDVLGKMMCALVCALMARVPVAQRISFSSDQQSMYTKYYRPAPSVRKGAISEFPVCRLTSRHGA